MSVVDAFRKMLPDRKMHLNVFRGPFRGATFYANPRVSMRKVFGLYEHELNRWLATVLPQVKGVLDVGANDGYFTFGCAAALRRQGGKFEIIAFEPVIEHLKQLDEARSRAGHDASEVKLVNRFVGTGGDKTVALDDFKDEYPGSQRTLVKIDVEGAEIDVIAGAESWVRPDNFFLIEVHQEAFLDKLRDTFARRGVRLIQVDQKPLPILGREQRDSANWWLVSSLS